MKVLIVMAFTKFRDPIISNAQPLLEFNLEIYYVIYIFGTFLGEVISISRMILYRHILLPVATPIAHMNWLLHCLRWVDIPGDECLKNEILTQFQAGRK